MPACPACSADVAASADVCPLCSTKTAWAAELTRLAGDEAADVTRLADQPAAPSQKSGSRSSRSVTSSSWLSSTDAIDHGRFEPGTLLDDRYRIVGRLGKGGMGEVYRADDLKLGQQVALKFGEVRSTASGFATSYDWARYIERTTTARGRWNRLRTTRPETYTFWYRTSPPDWCTSAWSSPSALAAVTSRRPAARATPPLG